MAVARLPAPKIDNGFSESYQTPMVSALSLLNTVTTAAMSTVAGKAQVSEFRDMLATARERRPEDRLSSGLRLTMPGQEGH
jgi:hypothetical protein